MHINGVCSTGLSLPFLSHVPPPSNASETLFFSFPLEKSSPPPLPLSLSQNFSPTMHVSLSTLIPLLLALPSTSALESDNRTSTTPTPSTSQPDSSFPWDTPWDTVISGPPFPTTTADAVVSPASSTAMPPMGPYIIYPHPRLGDPTDLPAPFAVTLTATITTVITPTPTPLLKAWPLYADLDKYFDRDVLCQLASARTSGLPWELYQPIIEQWCGTATTAAATWSLPWYHWDECMERWGPDWPCPRLPIPVRTQPVSDAAAATETAASTAATTTSGAVESSAVTSAADVLVPSGIVVPSGGLGGIWGGPNKYGSLTANSTAATATATSTTPEFPITPAAHVVVPSSSAVGRRCEGGCAAYRHRGYVSVGARERRFPVSE
ncbi:hypothetical protein BDV95DRAFT_24360 [Massariosphaeria phaeospora]|uniref:Uncharacterized protein n=1 Tax=Massariosphaeria phaeospora TaxID=100035 RepID=A0A7C8IK62_9PLEO|nr:hypothetical protein BDV95DRAFT_24360 [Massariosphaeria phaeospora]